MPKVSIILPAFNASKFLNEALNSIFKQTFKDFELIIINDGSSDNTEEIIRSYDDERIEYYFQNNSGVAATLNRGIQLARGKYIWRHDADDVSLPEKLKTEVNFLEANPDIALCSCQVAFMTERGKIAWNFRQPNSQFFENQKFVIVERRHFNPYCPITHGTVLVRRDVMKSLIGYREEFIVGEDVDCWLRLIQKNKAAVLSDCLSFHRLSSSSATQVHGWKNEFFRNLAFKYYNQRARGQKDDLEKGITPTFPSSTLKPIKNFGPGKHVRKDLLLFLYPLHLNAKDWKGASEILKTCIRDGWRCTATWKAILFPLLGKRVVNAGVKAKSLLR